MITKFKIFESLNDNFWNWFKDSKVVDKNDNPLIVFHGTDEIFNEFDINKSKRLGFWFSDDKDFGKLYGEINMPVYLSIKKPKIIPYSLYDKWRMSNHDNDNFWINKKSKWVSEGYDGLIVKGEKEVFGGMEMSTQDFYLVFEPKQIKSAENNNGNYSLTSNKITENKNDNLLDWFDKSKVVDFEYNPLIVYHGTNQKFDKFDKEKINSNEPKGDYIGSGIFFTRFENNALKYANQSVKKNGGEPNIIKAYLKIEHPIIINNKSDAENLRKLFGDEIKYFQLANSNPNLIKEKLQAMGYDGLIDNLYNQYAVFEPEQIKVIENDN